MWDFKPILIQTMQFRRKKKTKQKRQMASIGVYLCIFKFSNNFRLISSATSGLVKAFDNASIKAERCFVSPSSFSSSSSSVLPSARVSAAPSLWWQYFSM